ncbi:MAG: formylglycine-generating enzyme family protein [Mangrovibacterium sp.]
MKTTLLAFLLFAVLAIPLFAQKISERELYSAEELIKLYCQRLESYSKGVAQERFGIEELFGNPANQVFNDLKEGSATIELSTYLNEVTKNKPVIRFGLTPRRDEWEYVANDGQGRRLLVIEVPKEIDSRRVSNVFYISLKEHPQTGETIVKLANIYRSKKPGYTYLKLDGGAVVVPGPEVTVDNGNSFQDFTETVAGIEIDMVAVQGGTFSMGNNDLGDDETPVHSVTVSDFYMGKYEVTFAQYDAYCEATGESKPDDEGWGRGNRPVISVSWSDAVAYCRWLSQKTGKHYRLPTEAEWEYAARGGNKSREYKYPGSNTIDNVGWYDENSGNETHPVGQKQSNELDIYDMGGNVWEWCSDWYDESYYGGSPQNNPTGPSSGSLRVLRGGSWKYGAKNCGVSDRMNTSPDSSYYFYGFRLVLAPE